MPRKATPKIKKIERNNDGLIKGLDYKLTDEGFIDWRKMINPDFLVPKDRGNASKSIDDLEDRDLLVLLHGYKELAQVRGYTELTHEVSCPSQGYVVSVCKIKWIPNLETEGKEVTFSAIGDASIENTNSLTRYYLGATAENRAFVRCVSNFLKVNILGKDEIGNSKIVPPQQDGESGNLTNPRVILQKLMDITNVGFDDVKKRLVSDGVKGADEFSSLDDVSNIKIFEYIPKIKALKEKMTKA